MNDNLIILFEVDTLSKTIKTIEKQFSFKYYFLR